MDVWEMAFAQVDARFERTGEGAMTAEQRRWARRQASWKKQARMYPGQPDDEDVVRELSSIVFGKVRGQRSLWCPRVPRQSPPPWFTRQSPVPPRMGFRRPDWAPLAEADLLVHLEPLQQETLGRFGLCDRRGECHPLAVDEIRPFIMDVASREEQAGDATLLWVPSRHRVETGELEIEFLDVFRGTEVGSPVEGRREGPREGQQRLAQLADDADATAEAIGSTQQEVVAFLLAGWTPSTSWIGVHWDDQVPHVSLTVAMPQVTPKDVSDVYAALAKEMWGKAARKRTGKLQNVYDLLIFIGERFPDGKVKWSGLHAEYNALHPGRYTEGSMQTTFYTYRRHLKYVLASLARRRGEPMPRAE